VQVQFWGTRGSIPKPGPTTTHYGGNTLCHEIRSARGTLVIIDCGTGLHGLGLKLQSGGGRGLAGHILISHTHWDHIQGVPFFSSSQSRSRSHEGSSGSSSSWVIVHS
jgi:phosphoribosyl 1,2-cyclic phosphodiesterase